MTRREIMYCTHCGSEIEAGAKFCTNCGAPVEPAAPDVDLAEVVGFEKPAPEEMPDEETYFGEPQEESVKPGQSGQPIGSQFTSMFTAAGWNDTYLWIMALIPILGLIGVGNSVRFAAGVVLVILDYLELKNKKGLQLSLWVVILGALFNIVYLIARPHGTNKNYKPLIVFLIIAVLSGIVFSGAFM